MRGITSTLNAGEQKAGVAGLSHLVAFAAAYLLAASLSQWLRLAPDTLPAWWPPSGIYLAVLLATAQRQWPRFVVIAVATELAINAALYRIALPLGLLICLAHSLEALLGAYLARRWRGAAFGLQTLHDVLALALAATLSPIVSATVGVAALSLAEWHPFARIWLLWWGGDAVGILIVAPLVLALLQEWKTWRNMSAARWVEAVTLLITLGTVAHLIFSGSFPLAFVILPPLLWAGLRFGVAGAALATTVLAVMAVRYTVEGHGWFTSPAIHADTRALLVQSFLGIAGVSTLVLAALMNQRQAAQQALQRAREELEVRVAQRTAALKESETRFSALVETGPSVIVGLALDHRIVEWNRAAERIYGWSRSEVLGRDYLTTFLPAEVREAVAEDIRKVLLGYPTQAYENEVIHRNGKRHTLLWSVCRFTDEQQQPLGVLAIGQDITERKQAEAALRDTNESLRKLSALQDSLLEAERARIAREIHDDLGAAMTGVTMHVRMALSAGGNTLPPVRDRLTQAARLVESANQSVQRIVSDLRPSALDHLGIWGGIEWLANEWQTRTGLPCEVAIDPALSEITIEGDRATALFRIVQESLTNVARHAEATRVDIHAELDGDAMNLAIQDDGKGISAERLLGIESPGLLGMRERARRFGGTLQVTSEAGRGTLVALHLPLG